jgi:hypothetical protein
VPPKRPSRKRTRARAAAKPAESRHPVRVRSAGSLRLIERVRKICMALPEATEKISHGEPTWFAGKVFAMFDDHHHDSPHVSLWLPAPFGAQETLVGADPKRFFRPPYVGHKGWVGVVLDTGPDWDMVADLVEDAYRQVAPPRLVAKLAL